MPKLNTAAAGNVTTDAAVLQKIVVVAAGTGDLSVWDGDEAGDEVDTKLAFKKTNPALGDIYSPDVPCGDGIRIAVPATPGRYVFVWGRRGRP